jgi:hypothetical protein
MNVMYSISVNVHMNVMYDMNVCYASIIIRFFYTLVRSTRREKTLVKYAAVIKTINSILRTSVAPNGRIQNGDRAGVSIWPEGDHAGHTREVPQEDRSPSMYILNTCVSSLMRYTTLSRRVLAMTNVYFPYNNRCLDIAKHYT